MKHSDRKEFDERFKLLIELYRVARKYLQSPEPHNERLHMACSIIADQFNDISGMREQVAAIKSLLRSGDNLPADLAEPLPLLLEGYEMALRQNGMEPSLPFPAA
jgi:hypothetical protein